MRLRQALVTMTRCAGLMLMTRRSDTPERSSQSAGERSNAPHAEAYGKQLVRCVQPISPNPRH